MSKSRQDRRKLIFTDVRKPSSMWELILNECLQTLSDVEIALSKALAPSQLGELYPLHIPYQSLTMQSPPTTATHSVRNFIFSGSSVVAAGYSI